MDRNPSYEDEAQNPSPSEFDKFLPYACLQLQLHSDILISRIQQQEYHSTTTSDRAKKTKSKAKLASQVALSSDLDQAFKEWETPSSNTVCIQTIYDCSDNLVQLKFNKNKTVSRIIFKIIGLIIKFHPYLTSIVINSGINEYTIYEISKFLPLSNITDICFDGSYIKNANYQLLLEQENFVRKLSLARCGIDDHVATIIANTLIYPLPASKLFSILNLSSNRITDVGAAALANALRTNRQLSYLNLANNMITDEGASSLLNTLLSFPISFSELLASRWRHINFLKDKQDQIAILAKELRSAEWDKRFTKQKLPKTPVKKKIEKEVSTLKALNGTKSATNLDVIFIEKATNIVENSMGPYKDPFSKDNTFVENGYTYCFGNNSLCYLNLSYNNWSYLTLKNIVNVLVHQKNNMLRKPRGLLNISIEGNLLPESCKELELIDFLIGDCLLSNSQRDTVISKKKTLIRQGK